MKTVVGLVASYQDAEDLIQELTASGFRIEDLVRIGEPPKGIRKQRDEDGISHGIEEFFGTEEKPEVKHYYAEGVRRGGVLVSVFVEDEDTDRAAEIMIGRGVIDIERWVEIFRKAEGNGLDQRAAPVLDGAGKKSNGPGESLNGKRLVRGKVRIYDHCASKG